MPCTRSRNLSVVSRRRMADITRHDGDLRGHEESFALAKLRLQRRKSGPVPKGYCLANTISDWGATLSPSFSLPLFPFLFVHRFFPPPSLSLFCFFYVGRKSEKYRAPLGLSSATVLSDCRCLIVFLWDDCRLRGSTLARPLFEGLLFALSTLRTIQRGGRSLSPPV